MSSWNGNGARHTASLFGEVDRFAGVRYSVALMALLLVACNQGQLVSGTTPSPASCRLPVSMSDSQYHLHGGFIQFPGGKVTMDADGGAYYDRAFSRWLPVSHEAVSLDGSQNGDLDFKGPGEGGRRQPHLVGVPLGNRSEK